jgi:ABC-2 type transport system permease protein
VSRAAPLYWSLRRELWENRAVYWGPLVIAIVVLVAFVVHLPKVRSAPAQMLVVPFGMASAAILFFSFLVAFFYCLDALHSERRDRSILFWKSMPVSDVTTVAAKALLPMVLVPLVAAAIALATQLLMVVASSIAFGMRGESASAPWSLPWGAMTTAMLYGLAVHALWYAPLYGYLTVVSALARRANFLWAALPFFAAFVVEKLTFGSSLVGAFVYDRFMGAMPLAFAPDAMKTPIMDLAQLTPMRFLSSPKLWIGLAAALALYAIAVRLRRQRDPI